jgi:sugar (pentulose or hexulose) kinase
MADVLLADFGTSRVKCALWCSRSATVLDEAQSPSPEPNYGPAGEVELSPEAYWAALEATAGKIAQRNPSVDSLWLCTELHGIIIANPAGEPLTAYISWRDARSTRKNAQGISTFDRLSARSEEFFKLSGMKLRPGLPNLSLAFLSARDELPQACRLFTLPDWLLWRGGERDPAIHASLAAGTGLYDLNRREWSAALFQLAGLAGRTIAVSRIAPAGGLAGRIRLGGRELQIFGCFGDLQSAAAGAGLPEQAKLVVNLGTGSQVLRSTANAPIGIERRPSVEGADIAAITHIPSGRALQVFAELIDGCSKAGGGDPFFWNTFSKLSVSEVLNAGLDLDLNVFDAAWRYKHGGSIAGIHEGHFSPTDLVAGVANGWLRQYALAMDQIDPAREDSTVLVAGGLSRRAAFISPALATLSDRTSRLATSITGEETLDGLLMMWRAHSGER